MTPLARLCAQAFLAAPATAALMVVGAALQILFRLGKAYFFQQIFDRGILQSDAPVLAWCTAGLAITLALFAAGILLQEHAMSRLASQAVNGLRLCLFNKMLAMPQREHTRHAASSMVSRMGGDAEQVELALVRGIPLLFIQGTLILASIVLLLLIDWRLTLVVLASLPLAVALAKPFRRRGVGAGVAAGEARRRMLLLTNEASVGQAVLRLLGVQAAALARFRTVLQELRLFQASSHFMGAIGARSPQVSAGVTQLVVIGLGGWLAYRGNMTGGLLVAFITLLDTVGGAIGYLGEASTLLTRGSVALREIEEVLRQPGDVVDRPDAVAMLPPASAITFDRVSFAYGETTILQDVSFTVTPGQRVCLVGPSGSGKSTVLALLARLHEPNAGSVMLDGQTVAVATECSLREVIMLVPQTPLLFQGTIRDNILIGSPNVDQAVLGKALEDAALDDVAAQLPEGLDTPVGEGGALLSGGQRQRVAITRALVRNAPVLLLDEATSALDPVSESRINRTIADLPAGYTVLAVTHRLASTIRFDRILVFDRGFLVQDGAPAALARVPGLYRTLLDRVQGLPTPGHGVNQPMSVAWLRQLPFLAASPEPLLDALAPLFLSEQLPEDRDVFRQGDPGERFHVLVRGSVTVHVAQPGQVSRQVATLHDGDFFGEIALLSGTPRNATIRTKTDCWFLTLHRDAFRRLMLDDPAAEAVIRAAVAARLNDKPVQ